MTAKTLTDRELSAASYGKFDRAGVTVDVRQFLATKDGQKLLKRIHEVAKTSTKDVRKKDR